MANKRRAGPRATGDSNQRSYSSHTIADTLRTLPKRNRAEHLYLLESLRSELISGPSNTALAAYITTDLTTTLIDILREKQTGDHITSNGGTAVCHSHSSSRCRRTLMQTYLGLSHAGFVLHGPPCASISLCLRRVKPCTQSSSRQDLDSLFGSLERLVDETCHSIHPRDRRVTECPGFLYALDGSHGSALQSRCGHGVRSRPKAKSLHLTHTSSDTTDLVSSRAWHLALICWTVNPKFSRRRALQSSLLQSIIVVCSHAETQVYVQEAIVDLRLEKRVLERWIEDLPLFSVEKPAMTCFILFLYIVTCNPSVKRARAELDTMPATIMEAARRQLCSGKAEDRTEGLRHCLMQMM